MADGVGDPEEFVVREMMLGVDPKEVAEVIGWAHFATFLQLDPVRTDALETASQALKMEAVVEESSEQGPSQLVALVGSA